MLRQSIELPEPGSYVAQTLMGIPLLITRDGDGRWLFSRRQIQFLCYYVPAEKYLEGLNRKQRLYCGGDRKEADYPEALPAWQDFDRIHSGSS